MTLENLQTFLPLWDFITKMLMPYVDAAVIMLLIFLWSTYQTWRRRFYGNVHVDVTYLEPCENGKFKLRIRTIVDDTAATDLFTNMRLRWAFLWASRCTVKDDPIIRFKNKQLQWLMLNRLVNLVSAQFGEHFMRSAIGENVKLARFWLVPTFEPGNELAIRKVRVLLVSKDLLAHLPKMNQIKFEKNHHTTRIETLQTLRYEAFKESPDMATVEIAVD